MSSVVERTVDQPRRPHLRGWSHVVAAIGAIALCPLVIANTTDHRGAVALSRRR
ncbi:MAG: hypothetical protein R2706_09180 [Acidimicrobiales bacterium]